MKAKTQQLTNKKALAAVEKQARALELRQSGLSYERIAEELDYSSYKVAHNAVKQAMNRVRDPVAEDVLWMELGRLDRLLAAYWDEALDGDLKCASMCLEIMKRRAALLGLDQLNVDITSGGGKLGGPMIYIPQMDELFGQAVDAKIVDHQPKMIEEH